MVYQSDATVASPWVKEIPVRQFRTRIMVATDMWFLFAGFNSLVGGIMGFSILVSAEVFKHEPKVWYLDGTIGVLIGLIILAYGVKYLILITRRMKVSET